MLKSAVLLWITKGCMWIADWTN